MGWSHIQRTNLAGWVDPGTAANVDRDGKTEWTDPNNIKVSDANVATCVLPITDYSDWIRATNFGFSLPTGAVILGIEVEVIRGSDDELDVVDKDVYLRKTSGQVGDSKPSAVGWAGKDAVSEIYGGPADTWNAGLTIADIESSDFGVDICAENLDIKSTRDAWVAYVSIRINYRSDVDTGWLQAGTAAAPSRVGGVGIWANANDAQVDDDADASDDINAGEYNGWLLLTNFGLTTDDVPVGSTIDGIELQIRRNAENATSIKDSAIYLLDGDAAPQGDNKADTVTAWPIVGGPTEFGEVVSYGGAADTWNAGLTDTDVIDTDFGIRISAYNSAAGYLRAYVFIMAIKVYFSTGGETPGPYKLKYRKGGATTDITTYEAAGGGWNEALAIQANGTKYYAQCDSNTSHTNASDLRVRIGGVTYAVLSEEGTPT